MAEIIRIIPDDVLQEEKLSHLLLATCRQYRNMVDVRLLVFVNATFEKRRVLQEC